MFLIPAITALLTFVYLRPQEVFEALRPVTLAWVVGAAALAGVVDTRLGVTRPRLTPLLVVLLLLVAISLCTLAVKAPDRIQNQLVLLLPSLIVFLLVSQGLQSLRALGSTAGVLLALTLVLAVVGIDQGLSSPICYISGGAMGTAAGEVVDGRPCSSNSQCEEGGLPDKDYLCEKPGLFDTHSIGKRVRFRGLLEDPNELSWVIAMGIPLSFAFYERRRSGRRLILLLATLALGTTCVIFTKSRSGQLSLAAVLGVYFVRRFGWRGALAGVLASVPVLLFGGRKGAEAQSSSDERLGCWSEALSLWRENPFLGVGQGQFGEHHYLTAHNSFLLTLAELGPLGLITWSALIYLAVKVAVRVQTDLSGSAPAVARIWATALLASFAGMLVSAFFLSIAYHTILWAFIGLADALYAAVRMHAPGWRLRVGLRDLAAVIGIDTVIVAGLAIFLRMKGF